MVVRTTLASGAIAGLVLALAHGVAVAVYAGSILFGLAQLAELSWLALAIRYAGAGFLLYLAWTAGRVAWQAGRRSGIPAAASGSKDSARHNASLARAARDGLLTGLLNPKIALWFTALFSQFVGQAQQWLEKVGILVLATGIDVLWYAVVVLMVSRWWQSGRPGAWQQRLVVPANLVFALLLTALALRVLATG